MSPERWRQIEKLYHAALERVPGRRAEFLAEACRDDEGLRREVESLLAQEGVSLPDLGTDDVLAPGTQVGAYRIEATLGQGGMGVVYRALDTRLKRPVAIKFLSGELADATTRRRFQREAQMASSLNHPHIVTVHDVGEWRGHQYLVTEYIDGATLEDWARAEKRTWSQIAELLAGVADGLAVAHQAGILHRDIKPSNILVGKNGYAKLADFGLAKLADDQRITTPGELRTQPGTVIGTVAYMSPEQASGSPLDARSDIFSFGVLLYELLAGRRPFEGATHLELLQTIIHHDAEPLGADVPPALRVAVEKAVEKAPGERYQTMRELAVDLRRLTRQSGKSAASATPHQRYRWKRRALAAVAFLSLVIAGAATGVWFYQHRRASLPPSAILVLPFVNLTADRENEYFSDGLTVELIDTLARDRELRVVGRSTSFQYKGKPLELNKVAAEMGVGAVLEGSVRRTGDRLRITAQLTAADRFQLWSQTYERELKDAFAVQQDIASAIARSLKGRIGGVPGDSVPSRRTVSAQAQDLYLRGLDAGRRRTRSAAANSVQFFRSAIAADPDFAAAYARMAQMHVVQADYSFEHPKKVMPLAREAARKAIELDPSLAEAHAALGAVQALYDWDRKAAERELRRALELNPGSAEIRYWLAYYVLSPAGRTQEAIAEGERALGLDPMERIIGGGLAAIYHFARQYDRAIQQAEKVLERDRSSMTVQALGLAYEQKRMFEEAAKAFERYPRLAFHFGHLHALMGAREKAAQAMRELPDGSIEQLVGTTLLYASLVDRNRAFQWLERCVQERAPFLLWTKVDPLLDPLRADPRFRGLLRKTGHSE